MASSLLVKPGSRAYYPKVADQGITIEPRETKRWKRGTLVRKLLRQLKHLVQNQRRCQIGIAEVPCSNRRFMAEHDKTWRRHLPDINVQMNTSFSGTDKKRSSQENSIQSRNV